MSPRRFLAGIGRTLITAGVLLLLFVAYQLWGTGIAEARDQRKLLNTFEAQLAELGVKPLEGDGKSSLNDPAFDPDPSTVALPDIAIASTAPKTSPSSTTSPKTVAPASTSPKKKVTPPSTLPPSSVPAPAVTTTLPQVRAGRTQALKPKPGKTLGLLVIPRIKVRKIVVEGADTESLKTGPGHYPSTPFPGQPGNAAIACHRTTYGSPCFNLHLLDPGDPIFVQTQQGSFRYEVERSWVVSPKDKLVLAPTPGKNVLTLTTCEPQYSAAKRLIVRARLVGPAADSDFFVEPVAITAPPTTAAPTTVAPTTVRPTTIPENPLTTAATPVTRSGIATDPASTTTVATTMTQPTQPAADTTSAIADETAASTDAASLAEQVDPGGSGPVWSVGWFRGHRSTWSATLQWAFACAVVWIIAWRLARQRRFAARAIVYTLSFLVLFLPALYFCFENLARLLPENL